MRVIPPVAITSQGSFTRSTVGTCYGNTGYIQTVAANLPRFDYDPANLSNPPTLLLESAANNLLLYSEVLDNAAWTKRGTCSVTANNTTSPDNTSTADLLTGIDLVTVGDVYQAVTGGVSIRLEPSIWIKRSSTTGIISIQNTLGTSFGQWKVDLSLIGSGWVRIKRSSTGVTVSTEFTCNGSSAAGFLICKDSTSGAGTLNIWVWGAQLESGATTSTLATATTSYITTTSATVLRAADIYSGTGMLYSNVAESSVNMLSATEDFSLTARWLLDNSSISANITNDPINGYLTADSITKVGTKSTYAHLKQEVVIGTGQNTGRTYTGSVYLWCASGTKSAAIVISDVDYNSYTGSTITITTTPTRYSFSSNGGGTWNASGNKIAFGLDLAAATNGDIIYIWGAQLEVSASATGYVQSYIYEVPWVSGVTYPIGTIISRSLTHRLYTKLTAAAGSATLPENDSVNWFDTGPDNRWAMLTLDRTLPTYNPNSIQMLLSPGQRVDSIGLVGIEADRIDIYVYDSSGRVYSYSKTLNERTTTTWSEYFFSGFSTTKPSIMLFDLPSVYNPMIVVVLTKTTGIVKCSAMAVGMSVYLGSVQTNPSIEALNFSKIDRDAYGNSILTPRRSVPKTSQELFLLAGLVNSVRTVRTKLNATPALWSGLDDDTDNDYFESLLILGVYKEFSIKLENHINARVSLQLEEL